ncbi:MAG: LysM peptidoglycan-binding domain-containing protein [Bacteroidetes bacterium]|nr:LysM peptidoglycan-binding domain-containing protein [Bacteroidota bacterium]
MNCPVCNTTELSEDTTACPQCNSDLEVFRLIVDASEQRQKQKKIISALSVFAAVTAIGWASVGIFSGKTPDPVELSPVITVQNEVRTTEDSALIAMLTKENGELKSENTSLTAKINMVKEKSAAKTSAPAVTASTEGGTIIHTVKNGDTFWIIARKYFHDGRKYKQIAKDNGLTVKSKLHKGQKLKIVKG